MILPLNGRRKVRKSLPGSGLPCLKTYRNSSAILRLLSLFLLISGLHVTARAQAWRLAWSDEFDGAAGAPVDARKWRAEVGGWGWGNKEFEYYSEGAKNAYLDGHGSLVIKALEETLGQEFTCWYGPCRNTS